MNPIELYKIHINPTPTPYEIHDFMRSFNLSAPWVPHWDPVVRDRMNEERRQRIALCCQWIIENSTLKPSLKMNAKKARERASEYNKSKANSQIEYITKAITDKSSKGLYECYYFGIMLEETKNLLESEGYLIELSIDPKEQGNINYTIKW